MTRPVKWGLALLLLLAAASAAFLLLRPGTPGTVAVVTLDGEVVREIDLSALKEPVTFTVEGPEGLHNVITAEPGRIRVDSANCPDQICVHQGWISDDLVPIVCLPNRMIIELRGEGAQVDAITG